MEKLNVKDIIHIDGSPYLKGNIIMLKCEKSNMCLLSFDGDLDDKTKQFMISQKKDAFIYEKSNNVIIQPIEMYIVSNAKICEGDWYIDELVSHWENVGALKMKGYCDIEKHVISSTVGTTSPVVSSKKIMMASNDRFGLPLIPCEFYYDLRDIIFNDKLNVVVLMKLTQEWETDIDTGSTFEYVLKIKNDNTVDVSIYNKTNYTLDEVLALCKDAFETGKHEGYIYEYGNVVACNKGRFDKWVSDNFIIKRT